MQQVIIAVITSGALSAAITGLFAYLRETQNRKSGVNAALSFLLLSELMKCGTEYIERGYITLEELKHFSELYTVYKHLGGNGYADAVKGSVERLPIKEA